MQTTQELLARFDAENYLDTEIRNLIKVAHDYPPHSDEVQLMHQAVQDAVDRLVNARIVEDKLRR